MIDSARRPGAPNGLPASDQPRFAAAVVSCAIAPRRLQNPALAEERTRGPIRSAVPSAPCAIAARSPNTPITDHALSFMHDHAAIAAEARSTASACCAPVCQPPVAVSLPGIIRYAEKPRPGFIMMSQNRQQDIDRKAAENDYQINVKAEIEIELLHQKLDQLRETEVMRLAEAVSDLAAMLRAERAARSLAR